MKMSEDLKPEDLVDNFCIHCGKTLFPKKVGKQGQCPFCGKDIRLIDQHKFAKGAFKRTICPHISMPLIQTWSEPTNKKLCDTISTLNDIQRTEIVTWAKDEIQGCLMFLNIVDGRSMTEEETEAGIAQLRMVVASNLLAICYSTYAVHLATQLDRLSKQQNKKPSEFAIDELKSQHKTETARLQAEIDRLRAELTSRPTIPAPLPEGEITFDNPEVTVISSPGSTIYGVAKKNKQTTEIIAEALRRHDETPQQTRCKIGKVVR